MMEGAGKGKTPMSEESFKIPTLTKTKLGNLFSCIYDHEKEQRLRLF
jgi:hypothetical protein